jgi:hypothetical protein
VKILFVCSLLGRHCDVFLWPGSSSAGHRGGTALRPAETPLRLRARPRECTIGLVRRCFGGRRLGRGDSVIGNRTNTTKTGDSMTENQTNTRHVDVVLWTSNFMSKANRYSGHTRERQVKLAY